MNLLKWRSMELGLIKLLLAIKLSNREVRECVLIEISIITLLFI